MKFEFTRGYAGRLGTTFPDGRGVSCTFEETEYRGEKHLSLGFAHPAVGSILITRELAKAIALPLVRFFRAGSPESREYTTDDASTLRSRLSETVADAVMDGLHPGFAAEALLETALIVLKGSGLTPTQALQALVQVFEKKTNSTITLTFK